MKWALAINVNISFVSPIFPELIIQDASSKLCGPNPSVNIQAEAPSEGLFAAFQKRQKKDIGSTPSLQLSHYLDIAEGQNALSIWAMNMKMLPLIFKVATKVLAVPASSAPVEVFSHGGIILRPHRAQMSERLLANLIFCKCNSSV